MLSFLVRIAISKGKYSPKTEYKGRRHHKTNNTNKMNCWVTGGPEKLNGEPENKIKQR